MKALFNQLKGKAKDTGSFPKDKTPNYLRLTNGPHLPFIILSAHLHQSRLLNPSLLVDTPSILPADYSPISVTQSESPLSDIAEEDSIDMAIVDRDCAARYSPARP
jgi:hypothetical protein